jgi:uncharacterized phage-associated protein
MPLSGYNVRKAAQVTAFFAKREGGSIEVLKVAKLLYLGDREFMELYDLPILFDELVSMPHGPVTSTTLNYINGMEEDDIDTWAEFVVGRAGNKVGTTKADIKLEELDELSDAEVHVLETVWDKFGHMTAWQLRNYTHRNCPEWEDPKGSSYPIPYERVLKFLGKKERSTEIAQEIDSLRSLDKFLVHAE